MTFNKDEYGSKIRVNFSQDISSATDLTLVLEPRRGKGKEFTTNLVVGSSNVDVDDQEFLANQYLEYTIQEDDLHKAGDWRVQGSVILSGEKIITDFVKFTVLE